MRRYLSSGLFMLAALLVAALLVGCGGASQGGGQAGTEEDASGGDRQGDTQAGGEAEVEELVMQGPANTLALSLPFFRVLEEGDLEEYAGEVSYEPWNNPDELRAQLSSGQADVSAVPTYVGANLYNRGLDVRLINVLVWGMLYVVGPEEGAGWEDFRGEKVVVPFKGDMPDLVFRYLAQQNGLNPQEDLQIEYVSAPPEAVQMLVSGRAAYAVLPEHLATVALLKGEQAGTTLARAMDMQGEWAETTGREPRFPQAGIVVSGELAEEHPELVRALQERFAESVMWVNENPQEAAGMAAQRLEGIEEPVAARAIPNLNLQPRSAAESREELDFFFEELSTLSPEIIGGELPDEGFYYEEE